VTFWPEPGELTNVASRLMPDVATIVTFCTVFASVDTPGLAGLTNKLLPEIANVALSFE